MAIQKTTDAMRSLIMRKSVKPLPNRPSDKGMKADEVKKAFYAPILDDTVSVMAELDRVVDETNSILDNMGNKVDNLEATSFTSDGDTTAISYTVKNNTVKAYIANNITLFQVNIPSDISIGFSAEVVCKFGASAPSVVIQNNSAKTLKKIQYANVIDTYIPSNNVTCRMLIDCDEVNTVTVWITEV